MNDNKLIAEFMGHKNRCDAFGNTYSNSWNCLMPVVEKIEEYGYDFTASKRRGILVYDANFMDKNNIDIVHVENCRDRKEATYKAVVEFIKEYNDEEQ